LTVVRKTVGIVRRGTGEDFFAAGTAAVPGPGNVYVWLFGGQ